MKTLVTGSSGLVGHALKHITSNSQNREWVFVTSKDADLRNFDQTNELIKRVKPDAVINLAANVGGLFKNMKQNVEMFQDNILINMNMMKACHQNGVIKLISIMSTCIFPDNVDYPIEEEYLHDGPPHDSNMGYSYAKRMIDVLSRAYNKQYNTKFITIIPGNLYGPFDNFCLEDAHVIPALIHKCYIAKQNGTEFCISGTGRPLRQFTYSRDFAKVLLWVLESYSLSTPLIVSTDEEVSINEVAFMISQKLEFDGDISFDFDHSKDGQYQKTVCSDRLKLFCKNLSFTSLDKGLSDTIEWFVHNYNLARK